jgi:hypothetical protein
VRVGYRLLPGSLTLRSRTGSGFQAAMVRAHSRAFAVSVTPGNRRRQFDDGGPVSVAARRCSDQAAPCRWTATPRRASWPTPRPGEPATPGRAQPSRPDHPRLPGGLEALQRGFHNSRDGRCFPSYEAIAARPVRPQHRGRGAQGAGRHPHGRRLEGGRRQRPGRGQHLRRRLAPRVLR